MVDESRQWTYHIHNDPAGLTEEQLNMWYVVKCNPLLSRTILNGDLIYHGLIIYPTIDIKIANICIMNYNLKESWNQQHAKTGNFNNVIRYTWSHSYLMKILGRLYFGCLNRDTFFLFTELLLNYNNPNNTTTRICCFFNKNII